MFFLVLKLSFLELTTQFAAFLVPCSYRRCFLLGKLGVDLSIICNGTESRPPSCIACNSAICVASSISDINFLTTVVPEAMFAHMKLIAPVQPIAFPRRFVFVSDNLLNVLEDKHLSVRKAQSELGLSTQHLQVETFLSNLCEPQLLKAPKPYRATTVV